MTSVQDKLVDERSPLLRDLPESKFGNPEIELTGPPTAVRYQAIAWLAAASSLAYLCRNSIGVVESAIRDELGLTLEQSGWFMGAFFWTYAIFQVPSGWVAERSGSRFALSIFTLGWSLAMLNMGVASGLAMLIVAQLTMGIAQAGLVPATVNSVGHWMPVGQRSVACGILGAGMQIGAVAASALAAAMIVPYGWRLIFIAFAVPGILWTIGFSIRFRNDPGEVLPSDSRELTLIRSGRNNCAASLPNESGELSALLAIARNPAMWWLCGQQICRSAGYMFFASWFPTFLQETRGVSVAKSGYLQGIILGGTLLGGLSGGLITDWIWRRTGSFRASRSGVGAAALGTCSVVILGAWFVESTEVAVFLLTLGAFCAACAGPCAFTATIDIGGQRVPQVAGLMNMTGNIAAAACPVLVGRLFQMTANWNLILLLFAGVFLIGSICWILVNPRNQVR